MTKIAHGSSLPQARGADGDSDSDPQHQQHLHRHSHSHLPPRRHHHQSGDIVETNHAPSHEKQQQQQQPHQRDVSDLESDPLTQVVETVSVVQIVDGSGSPIETKTYLPDSAVNGNQGAGITAASPPAADTAATATASPSSDSALPPETAADSSTASTPSLSGSDSLSSAPSTFTSIPSLTGAQNASSRPSFFNGTARHSLFVNSTKASVHSTTNLSFGFSHSSSTLLTSTTEVPTTTSFGNVDGTGVGVGAGTGGAGAGATLTVLPTGSSTEVSPSGGSPTTTYLVGGIVGGFAGVALVVLVVLMAVKWKRQNSRGIQRLTGDGPDNTRASVFSRGGPPSGPGGGRGSWAIPAALASLTGYSRGSQTTVGTPETREQGFYRVSGRKLTSVLQSGGDGYGEPPSSDNRVSVVSGTSSFYRPDSIAAFSDPKSAPLQLGSPMRPESGVMIMRSGPARTPVHEQGPVFDDTGPVTPPALAAEHDPLGRGLVNPSGSGASAGSPSRFTEEIP